MPRNNTKQNKHRSRRTFPDIFNIFDFEVKKIADKKPDLTEGKTDDGPKIELLPQDADSDTEGKDSDDAESKTVWNKK